MYLDQHNLFDVGVKVEDMARISFLRQQDIQVLCEKVKGITGKVKVKQDELKSSKAKMNLIKQSISSRNEK